MQVIHECSKGALMTSHSAVQTLGTRPIRASDSRRQAIPAPGDDRLLAKLGSVGMQAALAILLSVFGLGSAMGQDMVLGANTQSTRDRVISEIRQARTEGTIKGWSPILVEVPFKAPLRGSRFEPLTTHQGEADSRRFVRGDPDIRPTGITVVAARAEQ
jgi:hypothetical protein